MFLLRLNEADTKKLVLEEISRRFEEPRPFDEKQTEAGLRSFGVENKVDSIVGEVLKEFHRMSRQDQAVLEEIVCKKTDDVLCNILGTDFLS